MLGSWLGEGFPSPNSLRRQVIKQPAFYLFVAFLFSMPLMNPYVHGDGVGYYAYARAPLIQHNLRFEEDWRRANEYFAKTQTGPEGQVVPVAYTETGYVANLFTIGPAVLWSPFLLVAHGVVLTVDHLGGSIPADGFSRPYRIAMAFGTAFYGFLGLLLSFLFARNYVDEHWALLATLGVWGATSLPVYMYFNPSWSHAHSAFTVALYLWYWDRTRPQRSVGQWFILGLVAGLMIDTYFPNGVFLLIPLIEAVRGYLALIRSGDRAALGSQFGRNAVFLAAVILAVAPTLVTRAIIFGGPFRLGSYIALPWDWTAPHRWSVLFSSDHGLLTWTPVVACALGGLFLAGHEGKEIAAYCGVAALGFYYVIASYPYWDGTSSFGNRFFISLTPVFVLGFAFLLQRISEYFRSPRRALAVLAGVVGVFALWNAGFIFQWGMHLIPVRGPISWRQMVHNQVYTVPSQVAIKLDEYLFRRNTLMQEIEKRDIEEIDKRQPPP